MFFPADDGFRIEEISRLDFEPSVSDDREFDASLKGYPDGSFYDFGSKQQYFKDIHALKAVYPNIDESLIGKTMSSGNSPKTIQEFVDSKFRPGIELVASKYVPFFDISKCMVNVGIQHGKLAVGFWSTSVKYGFAQWRNGSAGNKWISFKGANSKLFESRISNDKPVYISFGMGDFLTLKSTSLNFICFGPDSAIKNNPHEAEIKKIIGDRDVIVFPDNDESGKKVITALRDVIGKPILVAQHLPSVPASFDLRDFAKTFDTQEEFVEALDHYSKLSSDVLTRYDKHGQMIVPYTNYIGDNVHVDTDLIERGLIIARTGSGKTFSYFGRPGTLILLPLSKDTTVAKGEGTDFLLDCILSTGASITYEKFIGHYRNSEEFREYVTDKKIQIVVDECHKIVHKNLSNKKRADYRLIYELDAIFLSGTVIHQFRQDLPHYKFVTDDKLKMFYTNGYVPDIGTSLVFIDNAKLLFEEYKNHVVSESKPNANIDIYKHERSDGNVYATSCIREGISLDRNTFDAEIVVAKTCSTWTVGDIIQGSQRHRCAATVRVVTKKIDVPDVNYLTLDFFRKIAVTHVGGGTQRAMNAIEGEVANNFLKVVFGPGGYGDFSDYTIVCFINTLLGNWYDTDLYEFEELPDSPELTLKLRSSTKSLYEEIITYGGVDYSVSKKQKKDFERWIVLDESGTVDKVAAFDEWTSVDFVYTRSRFGRDIKSNYNKSSKKGTRFDKVKLLSRMNACCHIEYRNEYGPVLKVKNPEDSTLEMRVVNRFFLDVSLLDLI